MNFDLGHLVAALGRASSSADVLALLAQSLPSFRSGDLMAIAHQVENPLRRFLILYWVGQHADLQLRREALTEARRAASTIEDDSLRTMALMEIANSLEGTARATSLYQAVSAALNVDDHSDREDKLTAALGQLHRLAVVTPPYSDVEGLEEEGDALDLMKIAVESGFSAASQLAADLGATRREALSELLRPATELLLSQSASLLPERESELFETIRATPLDEIKGQILLAIIPRISDLALAIQTAQEMVDPSPKALTLTELIPHADDDLKTQLARSALEAAVSVRHWRTQASRLNRLNEVMPQEVVTDAFKVEKHLEWPSSRALALASLAPRLPDDLLGELTEIAITTPEDLRSRETLLEAIRESAREVGRMDIVARTSDALSTPSFSLTRLSASGAGPGKPDRLAHRLGDLAAPEEFISILTKAAIGDDDEVLVELVEADPGFAASLAEGMLAEALQGADSEMWKDRRTDRFRDAERAPQHIVNTGFSSRGSPRTPLPSDEPLQLDQEYFFWMEVGRSVAGAIDEQQTELPVDHLPRDTDLSVILQSNDERVLVHAPSMGILRLDSRGVVSVKNSAVPSDILGIPGNDLLLDRRLFFRVVTPGQAGRYLLRCSILHRGILIQSREVRLDVGVYSGQSESPALRTRLDYTISRNLSIDGFADHRQHLLSLLINDSGDGGHNFHFVGEKDLEGTATFDAVQVQNIIIRLRRGLRVASWGTANPWTQDDVYRYGSSADFHQLFRDLHRMAQEGIRVFDSIVDRITGGAEASARLRESMRSPGRIQLALRDSVRTVIPISLLYDYPFDAALDLNECRLCDQFTTDAQNDSLTDQVCFTGQCPNYSDRSVVCPGGFWGFRHDLGVSISLTTDSAEPMQVPSLIGTTTDAKPIVAVCTDEQFQLRNTHIESLRLIAGFKYAEDRDGTIRLMQESSDAPIIYFYCHGGLDVDTPYIQVGPLTDPHIERSTLREYAIRWSESRPLVFVNGCHTVNVEPENAVELVSGFIETAGASAVVGTEITIFEQLATEFGESFLSDFLVLRNELGRTIRNARLRLLSNSLNPLGLVYVPFGLADLRISDPVSA